MYRYLIRNVTATSGGTICIVRLIGYVRRSSAGEEAVSIADQKRQLGERAADLEADLVDVVEEPMGTSGDRSWRERKVGEVIRRLEAGEADGIIVAYFSRLTREKLSESLGVLEALEPYWLVSHRERMQLAPGEDKTAGLPELVYAWQARQERSTLRGHLHSGKHECWERGTVVGKPPAGYAYDREPWRYRTRPGPLYKTPAADVCADAIRARAAGATWMEICRILERGGLTTRGGRGKPGRSRWIPQSAAGMVRSPVYAGVLRCTCGCKQERFIPELAVVEPSVWAKAQEPHGVAGRRGRPRGTGIALLARIARCGGCGNAMARRPNGQGLVTYGCQNKACDERAHCMLTDLDRLVLDAAFGAWVVLESQRPGISVEEVATLEWERDQARDELEAFLRAARASDPGFEEAATERRELLEATEQELVEATLPRETTVGDFGAARRAFERSIGDPESLDAQRALLRETVTAVHVYRAPRGTALIDRIKIQSVV